MKTSTNVEKRPLPANWQWKQLSDILTNIENGSRPRGGVAGISTGVLSIGAEHISEHGDLNLSNPRYVPEEFFARMSKGIVEEGDILLVKDGATTGRVALIENDPDPCLAINEHVFILRPDKAIVNPLYIFFALYSPFGQQAILKNFHGAAQGGITQDFAQSVWIPLPPTLIEQNRLATRIKEQVTEAHHIRQAMKRQVEAATALRLSLLDSIFGSDEIQACPHVTLGEISSSVVDGPHVTPVYVAEGIPFLTVRNIVNRQVDLSDVSYITRQDYQKFNSRIKPTRGDILYTKDGTMGVPCVVDWDFEFSFFVSVALIRLLQDRADPYFVAFALDSPYVLKQVDALGAGSGLKHMVLESIRKIDIPLPQLDQQEQIVWELKEKLAKIQTLSRVLKKQEEAINALPNALMQGLFGGYVQPDGN